MLVRNLNRMKNMFTLMFIAINITAAIVKRESKMSEHILNLKSNIVDKNHKFLLFPAAVNISSLLCPARC